MNFYLTLVHCSERQYKKAKLSHQQTEIEKRQN